MHLQLQAFEVHEMHLQGVFGATNYMLNIQILKSVHVF